MLTLTVISVILVLVSGGNPNPSGGGPPKGQNPPPNPCGDGVKVTCPECKHAASDAACAALDQWITCPSPNGICYRFNQTNSALGTRITKGCLPIPSCENAALQPGDQACDKVAADPSATNCRSCNFDEAQCPPTDPTPTPPPANDPCGETDLYCLTCENAADDAVCQNTGSYRICLPDSICFRQEKNIDSTHQVISRGCIEKSMCHADAMGSNALHCHDPGNGDLSHCDTCSYFTEETEGKPYYHCGPIETGRCRCHGDPHCQQFDMPDEPEAEPMLIRGTCFRTLYQDYCPENEGGTNEQPTVHILGKFKRAKPYYDRTFVQEVEIRMYNMGTTYVITLRQDNAVELYNTITEFSTEFSTDSYENEQQFPGMMIEKHDDIVTVNLPNNMAVLWDGLKVVEIHASKNQMGKVCGICGSFDGNPDIDLAMGENTANMGRCNGKAVPVGSTGQLANDIQTFANSWIDKMDVEDEYCLLDCNLEEE